MLIQFNFENYKSFSAEASLDMTAAAIKEHPYNLIHIENAKSAEDYVKVAAIYGANASGKTSVIDAFGFMLYFIRHSFKNASDDERIPVKPFAFTDEPKDSTFEVFFRTADHNEYQYGFSVNEREVVEEWLYKRDFRTKQSFKPLFERERQQFSSNKIKHAKAFESIVHEKTLFLSMLANAKIPVIQEVFDWFSSVSIIDFGNATLEHILTHSIPSEIEIEHEAVRKDIVIFLNAIGVPVDELKVERFEEDGEEGYRLFSIYKHNGKKIVYPFKEESSGTKKMFALYLQLLTVLKNGSLILVDELDAKLHPLLLRYVINLFHDEKHNPNGAQLIYTTHDNYTLTKDLFRRDQIWFTEKQPDLTAELYSLVEYKLDDAKKIRYDASFNKDYLLGKYGGVPVLKEFSSEYIT